MYRQRPYRVIETLMTVAAEETPRRGFKADGAETAQGRRLGTRNITPELCPPLDTEPEQVSFEL
jgi:hypothetical protein